MSPPNQHEILWVQCQIVGHFGTSLFPLPTKEESRVSGQLEGGVGPLRATDLNRDQSLAEIGSRREVTSIGVFP